jgi:hypothetical protein
MKSNLTWTWRVTTPSGLVYVRNTTVIGAVQAAGMFGPESVQPATEAEITSLAHCAVLDNQAGRFSVTE